MSDLYLQTTKPATHGDGQNRKVSVSPQSEHHIERRDKLEIILAILEIAQQPVRKTHILYSAKINFYQLTRYLNLLVGVHMIEEVTQPIEGYRITDKGRLLLNMFGQL